MAKKKKTAGRKPDTESDSSDVRPGRGGIVGLVESFIGPMTAENGIDWLKSIAIAVLIALSIRYFFFEPFKIPSGSMIDTLLIGDKIVVSKITYGLRIPFTGKRVLPIRGLRRGDIIVFKAPEAASEDRKTFVKRLVALPGEHVKITDGHIYINGKRLTSPPSVADRVYAGDSIFGEYGTTHEVRVPEGHVYVLGDNTRSSRDSRAWGYVPIKDIKGPAVAIWWPPHRIQKLR
ncbi:MAG: signal peptidase I [Candidatus Hydrogenedentes bacterium]|nr:signal peptidase I [Candidatus Hydrogenedentota bacterium]